MSKSIHQATNIQNEGIQPSIDVLNNGAELKNSDMHNELPSNYRSELMESIRQGIKMEKVEDIQPKESVRQESEDQLQTSDTFDEPCGIGGSLARELTMRSMNMYVLSRSESEGSEDEDDWN